LYGAGVGTWGAAIFSDDFARDIRDAYLGRLADGEKPAAASRAMIEEYGDDDEDEGPIFWLALAATQWEYGALDAKVKRQALNILDGGGDSLAWTESGKNPRRVAVLAALARKLRTPPPPLKRPRRPKAVEVPSHSLASPDGKASATAFIIGDLAQVMISVPHLGGGGGVFAATCKLDEIRLRWPDARTLEISYPAAARVEPAIDDPNTFYLRGFTIAVRFKKRRS
jgi:hypothetical protein